jgi:hypothetical protein
VLRSQQPRSIRCQPATSNLLPVEQLCAIPRNTSGLTLLHSKRIAAWELQPAETKLQHMTVCHTDSFIAPVNHTMTLLKQHCRQETPAAAASSAAHLPLHPTWNLLSPVKVGFLHRRFTSSLPNTATPTAAAAAAPASSHSAACFVVLNPR